MEHINAAYRTRMYNKDRTVSQQTIYIAPVFYYYTLVFKII